MSIVRTALLFVLTGLATIAVAQDEADVLVVADAAFERITADDSIGLADLMIDTAMIYVGIEEDGEYRVATRTYEETRNRAIEVDLNERGWDPTIMVSGPIATVWYPYDIYIDGAWSHCGVDVFNLVRTNDGWRIAVLMYNVQQPPACEPHPDGPPAGS